MKQIEGFLKEHWYLMREIKRLRMDLSLAQEAYEKSTAQIPSSCRYSVVKDKNRKIAKPVEINAMIIIDEYRAQVESIEKQLNKTKKKLSMIEGVLDRAELTTRQEEYVRLRYFKNLSAEATSQRLYCSSSTCRRIRKSALDKIMEVYEKPA